MPPYLIPKENELELVSPSVTGVVWHHIQSRNRVMKKLHTLWICRKAIIRKNVCADTVKSSRCCLFKLTNASCGSFSHGSTRPGPLIRIPVEIPSMTRRKQSPGLNGIPADEIIFSVNSSKACMLMVGKKKVLSQFDSKFSNN